MRGRKAGMFSRETLEQVRAQEEKWNRSTEGYGPVKEATTYSGIEINPVYAPSDIADMDCDDVPLPGQYPYTRGFNPLGYRVEPWASFQGFGFGAGADSRRRWECLRGIGATGRIGGDEADELPSFRMLIDLPTQRGYDPDEPEARGRVGGCGISLSTTEDLKLLLDGVPLDKVCVQLIGLNSSMITNALYIAYAETRGYSPERLFVRGSNILYHCCQHDVVSFPPKYALRLMTELIHYLLSI